MLSNKPLDFEELKKEILKKLDEYIIPDNASFFKKQFNNHHFNNEAKALRDAVIKANSSEKLYDLISSTKNDIWRSINIAKRDPSKSSYYTMLSQMKTDLTAFKPAEVTTKIEASSTNSTSLTVYRFDSRSPDEIRKANGFYPKDNQPFSVNGVANEYKQTGVSTTSHDLYEAMSIFSDRYTYMYEINLDKNQGVISEKILGDDTYNEKEIICPKGVQLHQIIRFVDLNEYHKNGKTISFQEFHQSKTNSLKADNTESNTMPFKK